jgi:aspartyl-tRNA synthetase
MGDWRRSHTCVQLTAKNIGEEVCLMGWVQRRRDHGGVIFVDLRDREGLTQVVMSPEYNKDVHAVADSIRNEFVIAIKGKVGMRPEGTINTKLPTGEVEVMVDELKILNAAQTPPFMIDDYTNANEDIRLKYRYLDLRRKRIQSNHTPQHRAYNERIPLRQRLPRYRDTFPY